MPGWIAPVPENFSVNKWICRKQAIEIVLRGFVCFLFQILYLAFTDGFNLKKLKLIQLILELVPERKFSGEQ